MITLMAASATRRVSSRIVSGTTLKSRAHSSARRSTSVDVGGVTNEICIPSVISHWVRRCMGRFTQSGQEPNQRHLMLNFTVLGRSRAASWHCATFHIGPIGLDSGNRRVPAPTAFGAGQSSLPDEPAQVFFGQTGSFCEISQRQILILRRCGTGVQIDLQTALNGAANDIGQRAVVAAVCLCQRTNILQALLA